MTAEASFTLAIEAIYNAAADADQWPHALQSVANVFGDVGANLIYRRDDGSAATIVSANLQTAQEDYASGWWERDIRWTRAQEFAYRSHSGAITDRHIVSEEEQKTHPFYTNFQQRHGLRWIASVEVSPEPFVIVALSVHRGPLAAPYSDEELERFTRIGRHVEQALRLSIRLIRAELTNIGLIDVLSNMNEGVFVLDGNANVIFSNSVSKSFCNDGLKMAGSRLVLTHPGPHRELQERLATAAGDYLCQPQSLLSPIIIERNSGKRPIVLYLLPIRSVRHSPLERELGQARAIVIVRDLNGQQTPDPGLVRDVLGVTLAEARVAALIATGISPRETATALGIKEDTARSALKSVYAKAGLARQSELSALIGRLAFRLPT